MESGTRCELSTRPYFAPVDQRLPLAREREKSNNWRDFRRFWRFWRSAFRLLRGVRNHEPQVLASVAIGTLPSNSEKQLKYGCGRCSCGTKAALAIRTERDAIGRSGTWAGATGWQGHATLAA